MTTRSLSWASDISERLVFAGLGGATKLSSLASALEYKTDRWRPDKKLELLLAGYNGSRNMGSDARVHELVRQVGVVLGSDRTALSVTTINPELTSGYFGEARQVLLPSIFLRTLLEECSMHHGVIACEGSMFKSTFANTLTGLMATALSIASAQGKVSVGYGGEAGAMDPFVSRYVEKHCRHSLIVCRNQASQAVLDDMGLRTRLGTDTAWTFQAAPLVIGSQILRDRGWDGVKDVLVVCPVDPFAWPVKPDLVKSAWLATTGRGRESHYRSIYFHATSDQRKSKTHAYLTALSNAIREHTSDGSTFVVVVGTEAVDRAACDKLAAMLDPIPPVLMSDAYDMFRLISVLRSAKRILSSRYHAIVTSMTGLVPSAGIAFDERVENLFALRGDPCLFARVDDPNLADRCTAMLRALKTDAEAISDRIGRTIPNQLRLMGRMGVELGDEVSRVYPEFERPDLSRAWDAHLPPLSMELHKILEKYA